MHTILFMLCLRLFWPSPLFGVGGEWNPNSPARWKSFAEIAVGMANAQPDTVAYFVNSCYRNRTLSAAFGVNWHFGRLTVGHLTGLRQLLLMSGDVESNPGPTTEERTCTTCGKVFGRLSELNRHKKSVHDKEKRYTCDHCDFSAFGVSDMERHGRTHIASTSTPTLTCNQCGHISKRPGDLKRHMKGHDNEPATKRARNQESDKEIQKIVGKTLNQLVDKVANKEETALNESLRVVEIDAGGVDPTIYLGGVAPKIKDYADYELERKSGIKLQLVLSIQFHKQLEPSTTCIRGFRSKQLAIFRGSDEQIPDEFPRILNAIDKFIKEESGWVITQLLSLKLHMVTCKPIRGSTYRPLPRALADKKAIVNVQNNDNKCFVWSILAMLHPVAWGKNPTRVTKYQSYEEEFNMTGVDLPVRLEHKEI